MSIHDIYGHVRFGHVRAAAYDRSGSVPKDSPRRPSAAAARRRARSGRQTPLGRLLRERRQALGYSRARVSDLTGIRRGTLEGWELGRVAKPPLDDVLRLTRFLGISPDELAATVLDDRSNPAEPRSDSGAIPLLEQAISLFGWTDEQAAAALHASAEKVRAWRAGILTMTLPEVMVVAALVGLHAAGTAAAGTKPSELVTTLAAND
jgi:transcriptional regulator with XRE-family HTH domain